MFAQNIGNVSGQVASDGLQNKIDSLETRFNDLKSQVNALETSEQTNFIVSLIGAIAGLGSIGWSWYTYKRNQGGFLKIRLQCSLQQSGTNFYIVSKTGVENTSTERIKIGYALILIIDENITSRRVVLDDIRAQINKPEMRTNVIYDLYMAKEFLKTNRLIGNGYTMESISYYYDDNDAVGSLESLSSTHAYQIPAHGVYAVLFCAIGEEYIANKNPALFRSAHDKIVY